MFKPFRTDIYNMFAHAGIDRFDADCLMSDILGVAISDLAFVDSINDQDKASILSAVDRRLSGEPVDIILHKRCFYGLDYVVDENVLTPRSDTEVLVDTVLKYVTSDARVLDMCTGSGAIAVALAVVGGCAVTASDISEKALRVAITNAKKHNVDVDFVLSDMFRDIHGTYDVIVSNPPYIATGVLETLDEAVRKYDPVIALDGGADGLDFYREIERNATDYLSADGILALEIGYDQLDSVKDIFSARYTLVESVKDYGGNDRVVILKRR